MPLPEEKYCATCRFYVEGKREEDDRCDHEKAIMPNKGIRKPSADSYYRCNAMLDGICSGHALWQPKP